MIGARFDFGRCWFACPPLKHRLPAIHLLKEYAQAGRAESAGSLPAGRELSREDSRRSEAHRPAGRPAHKVRADHQSEDREGARVDHPAIPVAARGRGDSVVDRRTFVSTLARGLLAVPRAVPAQSSRKIHCIGYLNLRSGHLRWRRQRFRASDSAILRAQPFDAVILGAPSYETSIPKYFLLRRVQFFVASLTCGRRLPNPPPTG